MSLFKDVPLDDRLRNYLLSYGGIETEELAGLRQLAETKPQENMQSTAEQGQLIFFLLKLLNARKALELGVFMGYGSLIMALALPSDGRVIACELDDENVQLAVPYWKRAGVADKIDLRLGPALDTLAQLKSEGVDDIDFVFIDADKGNYYNYYELSLALVRKGGLIALDNTLWKGLVVDESASDQQTENFRRLNAYIAKDSRVDMCLLPLADGMTLVHKK